MCGRAYSRMENHFTREIISALDVLGNVKLTKKIVRLFLISNPCKKYFQYLIILLRILNLYFKDF